MSSEWIMWAAYAGATAGTGALLAGTLVGWRRHPAHGLVFVGAVLSFLGMVSFLVLELLARSEGAPWTSNLRSAAALSFFGGWLCCGPAFLWDQLVRKREIDHDRAEAELRRILTERARSIGLSAEGEPHE